MLKTSNNAVLHKEVSFEGYKSEITFNSFWQNQKNYYPVLFQWVNLQTAITPVVYKIVIILVLYYGFRVGQLNCASQIWLRLTPVAMVIKICDFEHKTGYNLACAGDMSRC